MAGELSSAIREYWSTGLNPSTDEARRAERKLKTALEVAHTMLDRGRRRIEDERRRARLRATCDDVFERLESAFLGTRLRAWGHRL